MSKIRGIESFGYSFRDLKILNLAKRMLLVDRGIALPTFSIRIHLMVHQVLS